MALYEVIDDEEDEKFHIIMDYCCHGEIMTFDEASFTFTPCKALQEERKEEDGLDILPKYLSEKQI